MTGSMYVMCDVNMDSPSKMHALTFIVNKKRFFNGSPSRTCLTLPPVWKCIFCGDMCSYILQFMLMSMVTQSVPAEVASRWCFFCNFLCNSPSKFILTVINTRARTYAFAVRGQTVQAHKKIRIFIFLGWSLLGLRIQASDKESK